MVEYVETIFINLIRHGVLPHFPLHSSTILVADKNNRRIQSSLISSQGQFLHQFTLPFKDKPYFLAISERHFAVPCENGFIFTYTNEERMQLAHINLNELFSMKGSIKMPFCICMDRKTSSLFISDPIRSISRIDQLTITGEYRRSIELKNVPFLRISLIFDHFHRRLILADSINSIIYPIEIRFDQENVQILYQSFDNLHFPQGLTLTNQCHLTVVECSLTGEHALKIFHYRSSLCHSPTFKTSSSTSIQSTTFF